MKIPLLQYCVMKNAIKCFKYLLVNGYDDPNKTMKDQNPNPNPNSYPLKGTKRALYKWDCMATAIYFGESEIVKILEERGFKDPVHIEAAILSYRNHIVEIYLDEININNFYCDILAAIRSRNIKGAELLISKGADINEKDIIYHNRIVLFLIKIIQNK